MAKLLKIFYNSNMKSIRDISVAEKRVLVRCDFNVPIDENGEILDDFRIKKTLPTIEYLVENRAKIILMSHLGNPSGRMAPELTMDKVAERLSDLLNNPVAKESDCVGPEVEVQSNKLEPGKILVLENLKFNKGEKANDPEFAKKLSFLGDIYVNDAFGSCHRPYASIAAVPEILPSYAGFLLESEVNALDKILKSPAKPMVAIVGGTKVETKSKFIDKISKASDFVIISGLLKKEINEKSVSFEHPEKIIGPLGDLGALDINEKSIKLFKEKISGAKTILWNGPFGRFEDKEYEKGTLAIANAVVESKAFSVVGGGETVEFLEKKDMIDKFSHVSTGGGAMLAYLSGEELPGLKALGALAK